jgi:purine-binding chemotaxis protein CheW
MDRVKADPALRARRQLLVFQVAGQAYALPLTQIREILFLAALSRPPGLPAMVAGLLNLGGTAVAVLRLDRLFGLPEQTPTLYTPLLLVRDTDPPLALQVGRVNDIVTVDDEAVLPVPADHSFNDCADGLVTTGNRVVVLLSAERLLLEKEQQHLAEVQDREQARLRSWEGRTP